MFDFNVFGRIENEMKKPYFKDDLKKWKERHFGPDKEYFKSKSPKVYDNVQEIWTDAENYAFKVLRETDPALGEKITDLKRKEYQMKSQGSYNPSEALANPSQVGMTEEESKLLEDVLKF